MAHSTLRRSPYWSADDVDLDELVALIDRPTATADYPNARTIVDGIVVYDATAIDRDPESDARRDVLGEIAFALSDGPGIVVIRNGVAPDVLDRATAAFHTLIESERHSNHGGGDHFAKAGANDRVWNALEKLAVADPATFVDYYESEAVALASLAWLGPGYQITSQVNVVNPGGDSQSPHRDYHLGFMSEAQVARYPGHVHEMSSRLTLQGAVAHVDMPVETGPTKLLPHSQKYPLGFLAYRHPEVIELFETRFRQPGLTAGDTLFFNPAVFHAAGSNRTTDVRRMANLLQVSSPFGIAMESIDRARISRAVHPELLERRAAGWSSAAIGRVIAAAAQGYAFPTNLDFDPPIDGLAPTSQADLLHEAVFDGWSADRLDAALDAHAHRRHSH
ncbi:MAG: phytanoyl-CoA dioxygenase family protein [Actinomycetota bacterium]